MYQIGSTPLTEGHQVLYSAIVYVLDVRSLGEVLDVCRAVEHHINVLQGVKAFRLSYVAFNGLYTGAKEFTVVLFKVVDKHFPQAALGRNLSL